MWRWGKGRLIWQGIEKVLLEEVWDWLGPGSIGRAAGA